MEQQNNFEKVYNDLLNKKVVVDSLDPEKAIHRKAVYEFIKDRPGRLASFNSENERKFLKDCIERDYKLFIYLTPEQYTEEMAIKYLIGKTRSSKDYVEGFLTKSFENQLVFNGKYETCDGEEVIYYDNDVQTVTFLMARITASFKVYDTIAFFKKLDVAVSNIGYNAIVETLTDLINSAYRRVVIKSVVDKKLGIYKLNTMHEDLERLILAEINKDIESGGIIAEKVIIRKLAISDAASQILEKQGLEILNERQKKLIEAEYEKQSLENYATKAAVHKSNPGFAVGLTEAEKDRALERYCKKLKFERGIEDELPQDKPLKKRGAKGDSELVKKVDKPLVEKNKKFSLSTLLIILGVVLLIIGACSSANVASALIYIGLSALSIGAGVALKIAYKKENKKSKQANEEQEALIEEYKMKV